MNMERDLKKQIVKSAMAVKRKVDMIRDAKNKNDLALETIFKPIVDPINLLTSKNDRTEHLQKTEYQASPKKIMKYEREGLCSSNEELTDSDSESDMEDNVLRDNNETLTVIPSGEFDVSDNSFKSLNSTPTATPNQSLSWSTSSEVMNDIPFGVRNERGKLLLGKTCVYDNNHILKIGNHSLKKTPGLQELLYEKKPNLDVVTEDDLQSYKALLIDTNAHRRNYDPSKPINSNKGFKYRNIIKPLFKFSRHKTTSINSLKEGKGVKLLKTFKKNTDYVYWDDPNELVDRLKLLFASRDAGNTGLDNEIISIIEELYEAGIITNNKKSI